MSFADERRAIESRFADNFTALPIKYQNASFNPPANAAWVALTIIPGEGRQASIGGSPLYRYVGVIQVDMHHRQRLDAFRRRSRYPLVPTDDSA